MSSARAVARSSSAKTSPRRSRTKTEEVATAIEDLLEKHGVAPLAPKALHTGKEIGKGKFKKVNEGRLRQQCGGDCLRVVVVRFEKKDSEVRELDILALLAKHTDNARFVPQMFGVVNERTSVALVQEHAQHGTLKSVLACLDPPLKMSIAHMQQAALQIAKALAFLETLHIVHADLACRNVLVFSLEEDATNLVIKITDFGLAVVLEDGADSVQIKQPVATRWCSPEAVTLNKLSHRSDVWSCGVTLWELFTECDLPWKKIEKRTEVTSHLIELASHKNVQPDLSIQFPIPDSCPRGTYDMILSCLQIDEMLRPSAAHLHEILLQVNDALPKDVPDSIGVSVEALATADSASTEASVADVSPKTSGSPRRKDEGGYQFEVLSSFLWSAKAKEMLDSAHLDAMQNEIVTALRRDSHSSTRFQRLLSDTETKDGRSQCNSVDTCAPITRDVQLQGDPIRELNLPLMNGPVRQWQSAPPLSIWTLWSLLDDGSLRRRDFASEDVARSALKADGFGALVEQKVFAKTPPVGIAKNPRWIPV